MPNTVSELDKKVGPAGSKSKSQLAVKDILRDKYLYLLALPGILYFLIFKYIPMGGILIAFQEYSPYQGFLASKW
jgi:putative aldouronate transport system permease protein